ncbi:DNA damage-inducible protein D [Candidatus Peregrinibacteria bacterium]|nr:DNA damage-inducible protein D [Candidatus Peregrinibacteria bacterium]
MEIKKLASTLEDIKNIRKNGSEYWYARELFPILGYSRWQTFQKTIEKAKTSCNESGNAVSDHFTQVSKMVEIGSGATRETEEYELSRYGSYLVAQNGDPHIPEIAFAQMYFAIQTRKQEVLENQIEEIERLVTRRQLSESEKEFGKTVFLRDVNSNGLAEIKSVGDFILFGNNSTKDMKKRLMIRDSRRPLADFLPTITIKAKELATEATTFNIKKKNLFGKDPIKREHILSNQGARKFLLDLDIIPEILPPSEDLRKVERRHEKQKKIASKGTSIIAEKNEDELIIDVPLDVKREQIEKVNALLESKHGEGKVIFIIWDGTKEVSFRYPKGVQISEDLGVEVMQIFKSEK